MRDSLRKWIADADTRSSIAAFKLKTPLQDLAYQDDRILDLYSSMVGALFDRIESREAESDLINGEQPGEEPVEPDPRDWPTLGNGLALVAEELDGRTRSDALFFAASAYYIGGLSASAYLTMRHAEPALWDVPAFRDCYDLLARGRDVPSERVAATVAALSRGDSDQISELSAAVALEAERALDLGPDEWISNVLLAALMDRFQRVNVRAVLPNGDDQRWTPLVTSFLDRRPAVWDFFPSQVEAINSGLLSSDETYSMQMPTGAGKTALTETLIFDHLTRRPDDVAVLLVPFRALARELRNSMGHRFNRMGFPARAVYGGTVPTPEETHELDSVRVLIATPEAMVGLLSNAPDLAFRISLLVCDEGHLLDSGGRGVGLELLLSRFLSRGELSPRMVFVSAVVPNIEEVNAWLGGTDRTVVRSDFRPADAEYAVLRTNGRPGLQRRLGLEMRAPAGTNLPTHTVPDFIASDDFRYFNAPTKRWRTYDFGSYKTQAIAAARKSLPLGTVAVFTRSKRGPQGVIGLTRELADQLATGLSMPRPDEFTTSADTLEAIGQYLSVEYGDDWVGTTALALGAVVHYGDIPQETREVLEELLVAGSVRIVLCTSTLAEGVNLPIRTLVLYSTQFQTDAGSFPMMAREIRNLVGRAGRAGSSTKGLVITANANQWDAIADVADGAPGEAVEGALLKVIERLTSTLQEQRGTLTNLSMEVRPELFSTIDAIDSTLIELLADDVGADEFARIAREAAAATYAARRAEPPVQAVLENVFTLRAGRLVELRDNDRLGWARGTGARVRLLDSIAESLLPSFDRWATVEDPRDPEMLDAFLQWAWRQAEFTDAVRDAYPSAELVGPQQLPPRSDLLEQLRLWLAGDTFADMAATTSTDVDRLLRIQAGALSYAFLTLMEQAVVVLERILSDGDEILIDLGTGGSATDGPADEAPQAGDGTIQVGDVDAVASGIAPAVLLLPDFIRYGVSTLTARNLMASGIRHRRAANALAQDAAFDAEENVLLPTIDVARIVVEQDRQRWVQTLGAFVYERTTRDLGITSPEPG